MSADVASPSDTVQIPSTPPSASEQPMQNSISQKITCTPPPRLSSSMTPPPSTQPNRGLSPGAQSTSRNETTLPASPPTTLKSKATGALPSIEVIRKASIEELRAIAQELLTALTEARMSAAHFKLQHTLLAMETREAAERAEVEHMMTRKEVEVLHAAELRHRIAAATPRIVSQPSPQPQIVALTKTCRLLEDERDEFEDRLEELKKVLNQEKDRAELLAEENILLKKRIRENREHFTKLKESPIYSTPRNTFTTPRRKSFARFADDTPAHEPFAALLYADQMLSQETASVPSTPTAAKSHASRLKHGHIRGAHSLSSLHSTPIRRLTTSDGFSDARLLASAPGSQLVNDSSHPDHHDRDSTISISDAEDGSVDDVLQSQASSLATDMLRRNPASQETIRQSQEAERSSNLLQTKLFGSVKKAGMGKQKGKRSASKNFEEQITTKKSKADKPVGLGVAMERWN